MTFGTVTTRITDSSFNTGRNNNLMATFLNDTVITGIDVIGGYGFQPTSGISFPTFLQSYVEHGVQRGASGYTPVGCIASPDAPNWIIHEAVQPIQGGAVFPGPGTNNAFVERYGFTMRWRGQLPITSTTDVYFSNGSNQGAGVDPWRLFCTIRMFWDTLV